MRILLIETSTERGLLSIIENDKIISTINLPFGLNQSKFLMIELERLIHPSSLGEARFDCIAVGIGPGSYTGIRIGVSVAKALSFAWGIPLIGVCSLMGFVPQEENKIFAGLIDAKIGGVYLIKGIKQQNQISFLSEPKVVELENLESLLKDVEIIVAPTTAQIQKKIQALYPHLSCEWKEQNPSPEALVPVIKEKYEKKEWSMNSSLELLYLRKTEAEREKERKLGLNPT